MSNTESELRGTIVALRHDVQRLERERLLTVDAIKSLQKTIRLQDKQIADYLTELERLRCGVSAPLVVSAGDAVRIMGGEHVD